jgi:hypothetical protein
MEDNNFAEDLTNSFGDQPSAEISDDEFSSAASPSDTHGRINLRIEKRLEQEIHDIADDTRYPLKSVSQVVRFCCIDGLKRLRKWNPRPTLLGAIHAANALAVRDRMQCDAIEMLDRMDERLEWYVDRREIQEAIILSAEIAHYFEELQDGYWKEYILREIDKRMKGWYARFDMLEQDAKKTSDGKHGHGND